MQKDKRANKQMKSKILHVGNRKVAIIGVGYVGASIAYALTLRNLAREIVLIDTDSKKAQGEAMDIQHGIPYMGMSTVYAGDYSDCNDCDLIIITAGRNRRNGETRLNLITDNGEIMKNVVRSIFPYYTGGAVLIVSNPVDILVTLCDRLMGLPNGTVFGTGCILDSSRMTSLIADYVGLSTEVVKGIVVGEHGDSQIPIWSKVSIGGIPMMEYCETIGLAWTETEKKCIAETVKKMGTSIISAKGRTHYGIATCVCLLADAILNQRPTIATVSSTLKGEYVNSNIALSVPSIISVNGVEKRIEERWNDEECAAFRKSAERLNQVIKQI